MATIKPFRALRPDPFLADQLVFPSSEQICFFGIGEKILPLKPLKEQLEAPARRRPETEEGQILAYQEIRENIDTLKKLERIKLEDEPGIYIYEIVHRDYRQTGIWALTSVKDYTEGKIKIHEQTLADSERRICNYRKYTGFEGSPVLLAYRPEIAINRIIAETCAGQKKSTVGNKKGLHRIWKIQDIDTIKELIAAFAKIQQVYLADGHHRLAATERLANENGADALISSLYIASDQLRIIDYHRLFVPEFDLDTTAVIAKLQEVCEIIPSKDNQPVRPGHSQLIGMWLEGNWYELVLKNAGTLDVVFLQELILEPVFGVTNPRTDSRLKCIGGETAMKEIESLLRAIPSAVAFTLYPMTVDQLMAVGTACQILPPKSTWIDPKVPYGLLTYQHSFSGKDISKQHYDKINQV
ncbi:DUF1015 family protein [Mucilaginibacter sp. AW1-7]|jgi:uncharacterized protein (DUF1015 family)|uniref:DUF1015 family protein n=1 Tax=Mucilaginibacter sp. AW1-7 TaxID=3349874 RepID=UPI003F739D92